LPNATTVARTKNARLDDGRRPSSAQLTGTSLASPSMPPSANPTTTVSRFVERIAMDEIILSAETNDEISIERCRELLGDDAMDLCDDEIDRIRCCADTVAQAMIEMFIDEKRPTIH
jgi:hypothetical protein